MFDYVCHQALTGVEVLRTLSDRVPKAGDIETIAPLFWADHCLECSPPACYTSCEMFEANEIGRCRRVDFMQLGRVPGYDFPVAHLRFRKWAKLRCPYNASVSFAGKAFLDGFSRHEKALALTRGADTLTRLAPKKYRYPLSRVLHHRYIRDFWPLDKAGYPAQELFLAFYAVRPAQGSRLLLDSYGFDDMLLTRNVYEVCEGLNVWRVPVEALSRGSAPVFALELFPADNEALELYILFSDLVTLRAGFAPADAKPGKQPAKKVKCVAWDLDNTVWDGVLGEDGLDGVTLRPQAAAVIRELDARGILNTVCSKNDEALAGQALEKFGLWDYFLYPKINWKPKSGNLAEIAKLLNIGIDSFAFVDDPRI